MKPHLRSTGAIAPPATTIHCHTTRRLQATFAALSMRWLQAPDGRPVAVWTRVRASDRIAR